MKLPSFQFYPGDWRKDPGIQSLSYHDRGVWWEMCLIMFECDPRGKMVINGKAIPTNAVARMLGLDNQILTTTLTSLLELGVADLDPDTGAIMCRRMVRDEKLRKLRAECGKLGGNPSLVNQNPTTRVKQKGTTRVNQKPTPSSSSSSSSSEDKKARFAHDSIPLPEALRNPRFSAAWEKWVAFRMKKKSCKDWNALFSQQLDFLARNSADAVAILEASIMNDWQGIFPLHSQSNGHPPSEQYPKDKFPLGPPVYEDNDIDQYGNHRWNHPK